MSKEKPTSSEQAMTATTKLAGNLIDDLKQENKRLREASSNLLEAMNQYSFFLEGYAAGSASISECNHANDELNKAQNVLFELLKTH